MPDGKELFPAEQRTASRVEDGVRLGADHPDAVEPCVDVRPITKVGVPETPASAADSRIPVNGVTRERI